MLHKGVIGMSAPHYLRAYLTAHDGKSTRTSNRGTPACWERLRAIPWKKKNTSLLGMRCGVLTSCSTFLSPTPEDGGVFGKRTRVQYCAWGSDCVPEFRNKPSGSRLLQKLRQCTLATFVRRSRVHKGTIRKVRDVLGVIPSGWRLREVYLLPIPFLVASPLLFNSTFPPDWGKEEKVTLCRAKGEQTNSWSLWCSTGIPLAPIISTGTFCPLESENHNVAIESPTRIGFHKRSLVLCKRRMN